MALPAEAVTKFFCELARGAADTASEVAPADVSERRVYAAAARFAMLQPPEGGVPGAVSSWTPPAQCPDKFPGFLLYFHRKIVYQT